MAESRDHRRKKGTKPIKVSGKPTKHKEKNFSIKPTNRYLPELKEVSEDMGADLIAGDIDEVAADKERALAIRASADKELHSLDNAIVRPMLITPMAQATINDPPENVQQAFAQSRIHIVRTNGFLESQKKNREHYLNPQVMAAPNVRRDTKIILIQAKLDVETYKINLDEPLIADQYGNIPPLASPKEMTFLHTIMPQDQHLEGDIAQLHLYLLTNLRPDQKPDAISLAQAYIQYRLALIVLRRGSN
ncbi:hypothetical protein LCGC14_0194800 [marine sediment metagenome]|uniref:Uncharacterized protein n=1 Tax=marine sediment metagenome TaxID=412755 RepID=A0A0F9XN75_9ZZZZ